MGNKNRQNQQKKNLLNRKYCSIKQNYVNDNYEIQLKQNFPQTLTSMKRNMISHKNKVGNGEEPIELSVNDNDEVDNENEDVLEEEEDNDDNDVDDDDDDDDDDDNEDKYDDEDEYPVPYHYEEYRIWRRNAHFMYHFNAINQLEWPSQTVSWIPSVSQPPNKDFKLHKLVVGTETDGTDDNYIIIYQAKIPFYNMDLNPSVRPLVGGAYRTATRIEPYARISHLGNVLRARVMPNNPWIIASRSCNSKIYLFDSRPYTSKSLKQTKSDGLEFQPLATLKGHHQPGRALTWQPNMVEGQTSLIASGGIDSKINIYQIGSEPVRSNPLSTLYGHQMEVMDVQFNNINKDMLVSVSRDKTIRVWDVRTKQATQIYATPHEINCVAFHPHSEFTFLTGSSDSSVLLWDSRNTNYPLFEPLRAHSLPVRMCSWFPNSETIFATGGDDGRIIFWDLHRENVDPARIRMENSEFNDPAYPRLPIQVFFIHGGHMNPITDFAWNANEDWLCTSMDNHHMMMTWRIGEHCVPKYQYKISELDLMASNEATNSN